MTGRNAELARAALIAVIGIAMFVVPGVGSDADDAGTLSLVLAWAWSPQLGALFVIVGTTGLAAAASGRQAGTPART